MDVKIPCEQSNIHYQTKASIGTDSLFVQTSNYNQDIYSDVFESIHISETRDTRSIKSQSFSLSNK